MAAPGDRLNVVVERPAVGGRMIARHDGAVVLVSGAIPGERVVAQVERRQRGTLFATTVEILDASPDRVDVSPGHRCAGQVLAHIAPPRQAAIKADIVADAFRRVGKVDVGAVPVVSARPDGYRTRARAHVRRGRWGFFEDGSHVPCDIGASAQLTAESARRLDALCADAARLGSAVEAEIEWTESVPGDRAVAHVQILGGAPTETVPQRLDVDAVTWTQGESRGVTVLWGEPVVTDVVRAHDGRSFTVRHHARSFFQGNRYLLQALVDDVASRIGAARVADLYSGVGLFARRLVADGRQVEAVESDRQAALDLADNARGVSGFTAHHRTVEQFVARGGLTRVAAVIVDPPRAGMGPVVVEALAQSGLSTIVYVSCDPATLARDVRRLASVGYTPRDVRAFDLFPRTGHVEVVVTLTR